MSHDPRPETPYCTVCLVLIALTCHTCVLVGNLNTAQTFADIGSSTGGWSDVGLNLGRSLEHELDDLITFTMTKLTDALSVILKVEDGIDTLIKTASNATDSATSALQTAQTVVRPAANSSQMRPLQEPHELGHAKGGHNGTKATSLCTNCRDSYRSPATYGRHGAHAREAAQPGAAHADAKKENADAAALDLDGEEVQFLQLQVASARLAPKPGADVPQEMRGEHDDTTMHVNGGETPCTRLLSENETGPCTRLLVENETGSQNVPDLAGRANVQSNRAVYIKAYDVVEFRERILKMNDTWNIRDELYHFLNTAVADVKSAVRRLLKIIKPPLIQIGKWLNSMSAKTTGLISEFSIIIDKVQKMMDEIMSKIAGSGGAVSPAAFAKNVFSIFDAHNTGTVTEKEFTGIADLYGITPLEGAKGMKLFRKYDAQKDGELTTEEFGRLTKDPSIPHVAAVVLRTFAKRLATISGQLKAARKRDEVAKMVANYLTLMAAKNETKVEWLSQTFTNGSLPVVFVADVIIELAIGVDDPGKFSIIDTGSYVVQHMKKFSPDAVLTVLKFLSDPKWWDDSGKDKAQQPKIVERITKWVGKVPLPALLETLLGDDVIEDHGSLLEMDAHDLARSIVERRAKMYAARQRAARAKDAEHIVASDTTAYLYQNLLGTLSTVKTKDEDVKRVIETGKMALPQTLQFAHFLALNSSNTAHIFQKQCFAQMKTSSNTIDSFATALQAGLKKIQNFLKLMRTYSTPAGIKRLETDIQNFLDHVMDDVLHKVNMRLQTNLGPKSAGLIQVKEPTVEGVFKVIRKLTQSFKSALPTVIEDMKFARREISAVSKTLNNIFAVFKLNGPPIFVHISGLYRTLWIVYFVTFALLTIGLLFYGFWASGFLGGPQPLTGDDADKAPPPTTFCEKCKVCCRACCMCMSRSMGKCHDFTLCFWSCILLAEVIVLIMFVVAIVLVLLAGIKIFLGIGCQQVYLLNDLHVCSGMMHNIKDWLGTFWSVMPTPIQEACDKRALATCHLIASELTMSAILTGGGSLLAAVVTGQLIFESARLHESAWWMRHIRENHKEEFASDDDGKVDG